MTRNDMAEVFAGYRLAAVSVADTGRDVCDEPETAEPVEIGLTAFDGGTVGQTRTWLVRPSRPISVWATRAHGISDAEVAEAPPVSQVADQVREALANRIVVAVRATHQHAALSAVLPGWCPPGGTSAPIRDRKEQPMNNAMLAALLSGYTAIVVIACRYYWAHRCAE